MAQVNDYLPMSRRDMTMFEGAAKAWRDAPGAASLELSDLDFVETHDCFTIAELVEYEAMGLTRPGEGHRAILEGWTEPDGRLPINKDIYWTDLRNEKILLPYCARGASAVHRWNIAERLADRYSANFALVWPGEAVGGYPFRL